MSNHLVRLGLAICTPIPFVRNRFGDVKKDFITVEWHRARSGLCFPTNFNKIELVVDGQRVDNARNLAAQKCLENEPRPEFLFFLDYDVIPQFDAVTKLLYRARCYPDYDIFAGVYCCKSSPTEPLIYKGDGQGAYWDWTVGDLLTEGITGIHMGCTLIRVSLFDKVEHNPPDDPWFLTRDDEATVGEDGGIRRLMGTEDLWFCRKVVDSGSKIFVDTSVLCGHIDNATGKIYGLPNDSPPVKRAEWLPSPNKPKRLKRALDLGAGGIKREIEGYKVFTTDIREDVGADYVMDTRKLNLPTNYFDLVMSNHHLEHIGRWEQETVWKEMFRICKPGGKIEHVVPNLVWAANKIADSHEDEHVYNVLYGAQEAHGYERELNLHMFGYTPGVAKALAEMAGFVNIEIREYRDEPELGYNLIVTGEKPKKKTQRKRATRGRRSKN